MAITLQGSLNFDTADQASVSGGDIVLSTSGLSLQQNDVLIIALCQPNTTDRDMTASGNNSGACTEIADLYANDTRDAQLGVFYAVQGSTPDTSITVNIAISGVFYVARILQYRGVDTTNVLDVATPAPTTGINNDDADPPSITPTTSGAKIVAVYGGTDDSTINAWTAPANVSNFVQLANDNSGTAAAPKVATADKDWTSGAFNPDGVTGGSTSGSESWAAVTFALRPSSAVNYTLTAASSSFTLSGTAASLKAARRIVAASASFALTGTAANLKRGLKITAASGSLSLTGTAATLRIARKITAASGSFTLSGTAAALKAARKLTAASTSYTLNGTTASLKAGRKITAASASFVLTGKAATLTYTPLGTNYTLTASPASFVLNGTAVGLRAARLMAAESAIYILTGDDAEMSIPIPWGSPPGTGSWSNQSSGTWGSSNSGSWGNTSSGSWSDDNNWTE